MDRAWRRTYEKDDALSERTLRVAEILNISERIQRRLFIRVAPCAIFLITPAGSAMEALRLSPAAALLPLHVVISGRGSQAHVHVMRASVMDPGTVDASTRAVVSGLRDEVAEALESVMRLPVTV